MSRDRGQQYGDDKERSYEHSGFGREMIKRLTR